MKGEEANDAQTVADELFEDNAALFRDSASEAESLARKRKGAVMTVLRTMKCAYPCYLYCFCLNPLGCMKSIQAVILNWCAIIAAVTLISQYWNTSMLVLFQDNVGIFMFLGLACFWTAAILANHMGKIAKLGKDLDESVTKMLHTEGEVTKTLSSLGVANDRWMDCLEELHKKNKEIRIVGRKLDKRKMQAEEQGDQLSNLFLRYGGKVTSDFQSRRTAIDDLIKQQFTTLDEVQEQVTTLQEEQDEYDGRAVQFQEDLEHLNETIGDINKPISDLEAMKPKLHRMGADPAEFEAFVNGHLQYLTVLERITLLREISYSRAIFFSALKANNETIDERLFNQLVLRLPMSLRQAFETTTKSYQNYRVVISKKRLGRKKYGGMDQSKVTEFMNDLEAQAFIVVQENFEKMPDPRRFGYEDEEEDEVLEEKIELDGKEFEIDGKDSKEVDVLDVFNEDEEDENSEEKEKVVIIA